MSVKIVFIGAGRMASAIVQGLLEKKHYKAEEIACTCGNDNTGQILAKSTGIQHVIDVSDAFDQAEAVVLACKPKQFYDISSKLLSDKLVLSILAGITLERLSKQFFNTRNIVRTMPNTPGQIGAGVTAYCPLHELSKNDARVVENVLDALGNYHRVEEVHLDAVTALSGSGPAYVFEFAISLREAGIKAGLDQDLASTLAIDTILGSATLLAHSDELPEALREAVTSPGGTTAAALDVFKRGRFRQLIDKAVKAAKYRSQQLARE